jgi:hypothetical protein
MPFFTCPNCKASITPAEWDSGFCPRCRNTIKTSQEASPPPRELEREAPRRHDGRLFLDRPQILALATVRTGCTLLGVAASMLVLVEIIALGLLAQVDTPQPPGAMSSGVGVLMFFFLASGGVVYVIGVSLCMAAPERAARGWLAGLFLTFLITGIVFLICTLMLLQNDRQVTLRVSLLLVVSLGIMHHVLLGLLATVSRHLRLSQLAQAAWIHFILSASAFAAFILVTTWLLSDVLFGTRMGPMPVQVFSWLNVIVGMSVTVYFVIQVFLIRHGIMQALLEIGEDHMPDSPAPSASPPPLPDPWE